MKPINGKKNRKSEVHMKPINTYGSISLNYALYNDFFKLDYYQNMPNILSKHTHGGYKVKGIPIHHEKVGINLYFSL